MTALIVAVLVASLLGSLHCVGMCGAFVAFAVGTSPGTPRRWLNGVAYHTGRLTTYMLLGAAGGAMGTAIDWGGSMVGLSRAAAALAGAMMIGFGVITLLRLRGVNIRLLRAPGWMQRLVAAGQRAAMGFAPLPRALVIGLLTTLLPCGWLYAFAITAAGTGSPVWGALTMAVFWLGTLPALVALSVGVQKLTGALAPKLPAITAAALVLVGLYTVFGRVVVDPAALAHVRPAVAVDADGQPAHQNQEADCPVCH